MHSKIQALSLKICRHHSSIRCTVYRPTEFLVRDSIAYMLMLSALYAIARPSVCLSHAVCHTGGSVKHGC